MYGSVNRRGHRRLAANELHRAASKARGSWLSSSVGFEGLKGRAKNRQPFLQMLGVGCGDFGGAFPSCSRRSARLAIQGLLHPCGLVGIERAEQIANEVVLHGQHRSGRKAEVRRWFTWCDIRCLLTMFRSVHEAVTFPTVTSHTGSSTTR